MAVGIGAGALIGPPTLGFPVGAPMIGAPRPADGNGVRPPPAGAAAGGGGATGAGVRTTAGGSAPCAELPVVGRLPKTNSTPTIPLIPAASGTKTTDRNSASLVRTAR